MQLPSDGDLFSSLHVPYLSIFHLKKGSTAVFECVCWGRWSNKGKILIFFFPFFLSFISASAPLRWGDYVYAEEEESLQDYRKLAQELSQWLLGSHASRG